MGTTAKGVPYPDSGDSPDGPAQIQAVAEWLDDNPGIQSFTYAQINALAGADLWEGRRVYQSNTGTDRPVEGEYTYNGVSWRLPWNMPWGVLAVASVTANQSTIGAETDLTSLTSGSLTLPANRLVKVTAHVRGTKNTTGVATVFVHNGSSRIVWTANIADGINMSMLGAYLDTPAAGAITYKLTMQGNATAGTVSMTASATNPARIVVEDVGPNGVPA